MKRTLIAVAVAAAFTINAQAQDKPAPPPAWKQGMSEKYKDSKLAPHPGKMTETPASEIPVDKLKAPPGFKVELWATGLPGGRAMALVRRRQEGLCRHARDRPRLRSDRCGRQAHGAHGRRQAHAARRRRLQGRRAVRVRDRQGAEVRRHRRQPERAGRRTSRRKFELPPAAASQLEVRRLRSRRQALRAVRRAVQHLRADARSTRRSGATTPTARARKSSRPACATRSASTGTRRPGSCGSPTTAATGWATTAPSDELNRLAKPGANFGFPYCHADGKLDADFKKQDACNGVTLPVALMGPHAAAMGVKFYTGKMFPAEYQNTMFIARKGSWNRTQAQRLRRRQRPARAPTARAPR